MSVGGPGKEPEPLSSRGLPPSRGESSASSSPLNPSLRLPRGKINMSALPPTVQDYMKTNINLGKLRKDAARILTETLQLINESPYPVDVNILTIPIESLNGERRELTLQQLFEHVDRLDNAALSRVREMASVDPRLGQITKAQLQFGQEDRKVRSRRQKEKGRGEEVSWDTAFGGEAFGGDHPDQNSPRWIQLPDEFE